MFLFNVFSSAVFNAVTPLVEDGKAILHVKNTLLDLLKDFFGHF